MRSNEILKTESFAHLVSLVKKLDAFSFYCRYMTATPEMCSELRKIDEEIDLLINCICEFTGVELEATFDKYGFGITTTEGEWLWRYTR